MFALALVLLADVAAVTSPSLPVSPVASQAAAEPSSPIREEELVLYALQLEELTLTDGLTAYGDPSDPYLPLGEVARLLDLDVDVAPAERRVTGRIGEARAALIIDLASGAVRLGGISIALSPSDVAATRTEIYLKASAMERIVPAKFAVDAEALTITLAPTAMLPIQARLDRIARLRSTGQEAQLEEEVTQIASPYELFSPPAFDVILEAGSNTRGAPFSRRADVRVAGDLLYTGFQGFVGTDNRGRPSEARLLFERRSLDGGLLGPLGATRVSGGDVYTPALPLGPRSVAGRGVSFTTAPLQQASVFDTIDLRGELPIGYDVELYINDVLRSGQRAPVQGRYEFLKVPLVRGVNLIRVVTYGPRGERADQVRVVNVGGGQLAKGQTTVDFGVVQQDRPALSLGARTEDIAAPGKGRFRLAGSVSHGLTESVTLVAGAALFPGLLGERRQIVTAGLRTSLLGMAARGDAAIDHGGGTAIGLGLAGQPLGVSALAEHFEYRGGFVDENQTFGDADRPLARHSNVTLDFSLPKIGGKVIPISFRGARDGYAGGGSNWMLGGRASTTLSNVLISTGLDYQRHSAPGVPTQTQLGGVVAASTFLDYKWQLRGALDYDLKSSKRLRSLSLTADRSISDQAAVRFGFGHSFQRPRATSVQAGANMRFRFGDVSLNGEYSVPGRQWSLGLRFAFGIGFDPGSRAYRMTAPGPASGGSASFRAFIDSNGNGLFDKGETAVPKVVVEGGEQRAVTDARGRAFVTGLGAGPTGRVQIGADDIDSFDVAMPPRTIEYSPRPGKVVNLSYPLIIVSEVLARLTFQRGGEAVGLSAVRLSLIQDGKNPRSATTEFDGTAVFNDVPAGRYRLELDEEQAKRLHMRFAAPITLMVAADGTATPDVNAEVIFAGLLEGGRPDNETPDAMLQTVGDDRATAGDAAGPSAGGGADGAVDQRVDARPGQRRVGADREHGVPRIVQQRRDHARQRQWRAPRLHNQPRAGYRRVHYQHVQERCAQPARGKCRLAQRTRRRAHQLHHHGRNSQHHCRTHGNQSGKLQHCGHGTRGHENILGGRGHAHIGKRVARGHRHGAQRVLRLRRSIS